MVEGRQVLTTVHQQRSTGVVHHPPLPEIYVLQSVGKVEKAPDVHLEPERAEETPELEDVGD
jgi:hypothetical protein